MLTSAELDRMRNEAERVLPGTAVIQAQAFQSDGGGGGTTAWTAAGTVPCRLAPVGLGAPEELSGGRISPDAESVVTLPFDAAVTETSRLIIAGGTFNVSAIRDRSYEITTRLEVNRQS